MWPSSSRAIRSRTLESCRSRRSRRSSARSCDNAPRLSLASSSGPCCQRWIDHVRVAREIYNLHRAGTGTFMIRLWAVPRAVLAHVSVRSLRLGLRVSVVNTAGRQRTRTIISHVRGPGV